MIFFTSEGWFIFLTLYEIHWGGDGRFWNVRKSLARIPSLLRNYGSGLKRAIPSLKRSLLDTQSQPHVNSRNYHFQITHPRLIQDVGQFPTRQSSGPIQKRHIYIIRNKEYRPYLKDERLFPEHWQIKKWDLMTISKLSVLTESADMMEKWEE